MTTFTIRVPVVPYFLLIMSEDVIPHFFVDYWGRNGGEGKFLKKIRYFSFFSLTIRYLSYNMTSDSKQKHFLKEANMPSQKLPQPTGGELEILRILWDNGPSTVKQVHEVVNKKKSIGYTTTLKVMQVMHERGLLVRNDSKYRHIYTPTLPEEKTQRQLVTDFLEKAFSGSTEKLLMHLLSAKKIPAKERAKIRKMLDEIERK
jgi:predicted transcriptional regulator